MSRLCLVSLIYRNLRTILAGTRQAQPRPGHDNADELTHSTASKPTPTCPCCNGTANCTTAVVHGPSSANSSHAYSSPMGNLLGRNSCSYITAQPTAFLARHLLLHANTLCVQPAAHCTARGRSCFPITNRHYYCLLNSSKLSAPYSAEAPSRADRKGAACHHAPPHVDRGCRLPRVFHVSHVACARRVEHGQCGPQAALGFQQGGAVGHHGRVLHHQLPGCCGMCSNR